MMRSEQMKLQNKNIPRTINSSKTITYQSKVKKYYYQKSYSNIIIQNTIFKSMKKFEGFETESGSATNSPRFHMNEVLARFSPAFTRHQQAKLITNEVISTLSDPNCFIRQNYHQQQWEEIFSYVEESYWRRFFLMQTGLSTIVQRISRIKFSCLKQLDLSNNKITNVELIVFLKIPQIKNLVLKNNLIVNINALRRGKWKNLEVLDIEGNAVIEWKRITQIQINKQQIDSFTVNFIHSENLADVEDIARLYAKLAWNRWSENIDNKIDVFGNVRARQFEELKAGIIRLGEKKYQALKRKFQERE